MENLEPTPEVIAAADVQWQDLKLSEASLELIVKAGYKAPSAVQALAIPLAIEGHDVIASAQTGTGKTAGFVLPMVERFKGREGTYGLILAPTREIAQQIQATIEVFGTPQGVRSIVLIGGINIRLDQLALQSYPHIIVATPGRLCDHLDRGNIWLDFIEMVVLDEADRMLDMGFSDQLSRIMEEVPKKRQTMLFSATIPPSVESLARRILHSPKEVTIGKPQSANASVEQSLVWMREEAKNRELMRLLRSETGSVMVFTRSKDGATRVWRSLHSAGFYDATYIHSDRLQAHREQALAEFKEGKYRVLIATDVAGRGIHVDQVAHVINYDLPMEPENYVHRIGRTGRAGATGRATTFATTRDRAVIRQIEKILGHAIPAVNEPPAPPAPGEGRGGDRDSRGGRGGDRGRGGRGGSGSSGGRGRRGSGGSEPRQDGRPSRPPQQLVEPVRAFPMSERPAETEGHTDRPASDGGGRAPSGPRASAGPRGPVGANGAPATPGEAGGAEGAGGEGRKRRRRRRGGKGRGAGTGPGSPARPPSGGV